MAMRILYFSVSLLLLTIITATAQQTPPAAAPLPPPPLSTTTHTPPSPPPTDIQQTPPLPSPAATPLPPPPLPTTAQTPPADIQENQLKNIIDALIGAGDFGGWANLLSSADSSALPLTATLFIPSDDAAAHSASVTDAGISFDPFLIPYHVIPQRLTFSDLQKFAVDSRIPTLLPSKFVVITNNSASNFTIDASQITQADIFSNSAFAVHGINNVLDYSVYGGGGNLVSKPPGKSDPEMAEPTRKRRNPGFPDGIIIGVRSDAPDLPESGFWVRFFMFLIQTYFWMAVFELMRRVWRALD